MYRKGAQDAKRGKLFTKIIRELTTAARAGQPDPAANPRLRAALTQARANNMPKDTIERAIRRGSGGEDGVQYEEMRYEGYGPGGVAIIVEALTDNRNRTASEIRSSFSKYGGSLGETNSVSFMFDRKGVVRYPASVASADAMFEAALEAGADNVDSTAEMHEVTTTPEGFSAVRDALEERFGEAREARLTWMPRLGVSVGGDGAQTLFKLLEVLEDNDDVQNVVANFEIAESDMARLIA